MTFNYCDTSFEYSDKRRIREKYTNTGVRDSRDYGHDVTVTGSTQ